VTPYRFGQSEVSGDQQGIDNNGNVIFQETLGQWFLNTPAIDESDGAGLDDLVRDLSNDNSQ
jgi:peroxidase